MLIIYTSYFAKLTSIIKQNILPVNISLYPPSFFDITVYPSWKEVMPSKDILFQIKNSNHSQLDKEIYTQRYVNEILNQYKPEELLYKLGNIAKEYNSNKLALCCFEDPSKFCHRHILADWLNQRIPNLNIIELNFRNNKIENNNSLF